MAAPVGQSAPDMVRRNEPQLGPPLTDAQRAFVQRHLKLVRWALTRAAGAYTLSHDDAEDLLTEGYLELCKVSRRYDPSRHLAESTYAAACLVLKMRAALAGWHGGVATGKRSDVLLLLAAEKRLARRGVEATDEAVALECVERGRTFGPERVRTTRTFLEARRALSLATPSSRTELGEDIPVEHYLGVAERGFAAVEDADAIRDALSRLPKRERQALLWRVEGWRLEDIGAALGVTRERARQIVESAARRARKLAEEEEL